MKQYLSKYSWLPITGKNCCTVVRKGCRQNLNPTPPSSSLLDPPFHRSFFQKIRNNKKKLRKEIIKSHTISVSYTFYHEARKATTESASQIHINFLWLYYKADKPLYLQYPQNFACWDYYYKLPPFCTGIPFFPYLKPLLDTLWCLHIVNSKHW